MIFKKKDSSSQTNWPAKDYDSDSSEEEHESDHQEEYIKLLENLLLKREAEIEDKRKKADSLKSEYFRLGQN